MTVRTVIGIVGNPRPESRTHRLSRALVAGFVAAAGLDALAGEVDLAVLGSRAFDRSDPDTAAALERVGTADVLVVASPTYKATYSGLLKVFLDHLGTGALGGTPAVPIMLGGALDHRLAVDVHLTPLLLELGASTPVRGVFVLEREVDAFTASAPECAREMWAAGKFDKTT